MTTWITANNVVLLCRYNNDIMKVLSKFQLKDLVWIAVSLDGSRKCNALDNKCTYWLTLTFDFCWVLTQFGGMCSGIDWKCAHPFIIWTVKMTTSVTANNDV